MPIANATENNFIEVDKNTDLETYEWTHRPVVIFANSDKDPNFISQLEFLSKDIEALEERDIVVLIDTCLLYTSPSPRDKRQSRMPSSA